MISNSMTTMSSSGGVDDRVSSLFHTARAGLLLFKYTDRCGSPVSVVPSGCHKRKSSDGWSTKEDFVCLYREL